MMNRGLVPISLIHHRILHVKFAGTQAGRIVRENLRIRPVETQVEKTQLPKKPSTRNRRETQIKKIASAALPSFSHPHVSPLNEFTAVSVALLNAAASPAHQSTPTSDGTTLFHHHTPLPMSTTANNQNLTIIGLGYAIAVALAFLVLFSAILLASYICCRNRRRRSSSNNNNNPVNLQNPNSLESGIYLPRILFVAEDDNHDNDDVVLGLDQAVINSYPKLVFSKRGSWGSGKGSDDVVCSICLCEYRESEVLRVLPDCNHAFHVMCVDAWLKLNASCPVCRSSPLPTPLSTPLQEVVPLSQYADGRRRM